MDPLNNQQANPQVPNAAPQAPIQPEQVGNPMPKTEKRYLLYGAILGLAVVVLVGVAGFYMLYSPKGSNNVVVAPTPTQSASTGEEEVEVAEVAGVTDLDNLIVGLAQADGSLDKELTQLEKDSDF